MKKLLEKIFVEKEAQASFEYVLMAAGAVLLVTIIILIARGQVLASANQQANESVGNFTNILGGFNKTK